MVYGSLAGVAAINAHTGGYDATSTPTADQVLTFLADGYAYLNARLLQAGYEAPVTDDVPAAAVLSRLNNLFAAACAEESTNLSTAGIAEESRSQRLWRRFQQELADFLAGDLTLLGLAAATTTPAGGRVRSRALRRRDGYADYFDPDQTAYAAPGGRTHTPGGVP